MVATPGRDGSRLFVTHTGSVILEAIRETAQECKLLVFDPLDGRFAVDAKQDIDVTTSLHMSTEMNYYGIVGMLDLVFAKYIFIVTKRELAAASVFGSIRVWRIVKVHAVPVWRQAIALSLDEEEHERICLKAISDELTTGNLYFSLDVDLTNSPQSALSRGLKRLSTLQDSQAYFARINERFFWNSHLLKPFMNRDTQVFVLPLICGHVGSVKLALDGPPTAVIFVSRINRHHAGTRYWRRGVDDGGHAAMEVEIDVLVMYDRGIASFCMIRGSVPLFWSQSKINDPLRRPPIDLSRSRSPESLRAMKSHFEYLMGIYGNKVDVIDMIERRRAGSDIAQLSVVYETSLREWGHPSIRYLKHSSATTQQGIDAFMRDIPALVKQQGYFHARSNNNGFIDDALSKQVGIIRINALDCVDETSIAQFMIALHTLEMLLKDVGLWRKDRKRFSPETLYALRQLWADNSDALSQFYTGTPMRHVSHVRQTIMSKLFAPVHSRMIALSRTYMGHFQDYARQDNLEYFMGLHDDETAVQVVGNATLLGELEFPNEERSPEAVDLVSRTSSAGSMMSDVGTGDSVITGGASSSSVAKSGVLSGAAAPSLSGSYTPLVMPPAPLATASATGTSTGSGILSRLTRRQQIEGLRSVKAQIVLRRRLSQHELSQPPLLSIVLLLRKFTAPTSITTPFEFTLAMIWLGVYFVCMRVLKYPAELLVRKPRRALDWASLPAIVAPEPYGIEVYMRQHMEQCKAQTMETMSVAPNMGSGSGGVHVGGSAAAGGASGGFFGMGTATAVSNRLKVVGGRTRKMSGR